MMMMMMIFVLNMTSFVRYL